MPDTVITVGGDIRPLQDALKRIEDSMSKLGSKASKATSSFSSLAAPLAGLLSVRAAAQAVKGMIDDFDKLGENAERLGVTSESMQRIGYQAKFSGTEVEVVIRSLEKMNRLVQSGDNKTMSALASLGLDAAKVNAMAPEKAIIEIADAFQAAEKKGKGLAEIQAIFGKQYGAMLPMLRKTREELEKFGGMAIVSDEAIKRAGDFNDMLDAMAINVKAFLMNLSDGESGVGWMDSVGAGLAHQWLSVTQGTEVAEEALRSYFAEAEKGVGKGKEKGKVKGIPSEDDVENQEAAEKLSTENAEKKAAILYEQLSTADKLAQVQAKLAQPFQDPSNSLRNAQLQKEKIELLIEEAKLKKEIADASATTQKTVADININTEEKKAKFALEQLSTEDQHEEVLKRISSITKDLEKEREPEKVAMLESKLVDLLNQQWELKQKINKENQDAADKLKDQAAAKSDLTTELAIADARSRGDDKEVAKLEKQAKLEAEAKKIEKDTGMSPKDAMGIAQKKAELEERAAKKAAGKIFGGVSQPTPSGLGKEFGELKKKGKLADQFKFPGLDKFKDLQRRGAGAKAVDDAVAVKDNANAALEKLMSDVAKNTEPLKDLD